MSLNYLRVVGPLAQLNFPVYIFKDKNSEYWAVECPILRCHTQGTSFSDAIDMFWDWVATVLNVEVKDLNPKHMQVNVQSPTRLECMATFASHIEELCALITRSSATYKFEPFDWSNVE